MENIKEKEEELYEDNENENENENKNKNENESEELEDDIDSVGSLKKNEQNTFLEKHKLFFSRDSLSNTLLNLEKKDNKIRTTKLPRFSTIQRREKKNCTILFQNKISLGSENINYPLDDLKPIPIILSSQKELVYLYLAEDERDFLLKKLDTNNYYAIREEEIKNPLKIFIPLYYEKLFKNKGCLEKRLEKSLSEKMENIKPNFSIAIEMDKKFKNTDIVKEQSEKYLLIKQDIMKHLDIEKEGIITFDPFSKIKMKEKNKNGKEPLPKWAVSLKKQFGDEAISDDEDNDDDDVEEDETKFNLKFYKKLSTKNLNIEKLKEKIKNKNEEEEDNNINNINNKEEDSFSEKRDKNDNDSSQDSDDDGDEKIEYPYKKYIKKLFYPKLNDFRRDIIEDCFKNKQTFGKIDFQKFICLLEFFISLFSGIQVKYSIDELGFLNMDLYSSESIYMNMAEILHYQVQFQIRDIPHEQDNEDQSKPNLISLNTKQYHEYKLEKLEYFPPSTTFYEDLSNRFRRYTLNDNYHLCQECEKYFSRNKIERPTCDSSVFRFIDKTRLLIMTITGIIDINYLEQKIQSNNDDEDQQEKLFKATMIFRNEDLINELKDPFTFSSYFLPIQTKQNNKLDNIFRNLFGEPIGYYYTWVSHYISWILFPAIIGLMTEIWLFFFDQNQINNYIYIIYISLILLWGFYYVKDWENFQLFYNYIWGIDSFKAEITNFYDDNYSKVSYVMFLGIKIPREDKIHALIVNFISIILIFFSSLFIMSVNVGIFKLHSMKFFFQRYIDKLSEHLNLSHEISSYLLSIIIYISREIISAFFFKFSETLAKLEKPKDKEEYDEIVTKKRLTLEFVNYYFNLYYIAFYKKSKNTCENGNCFLELRKQLILILISNICSVIITVVYKIIYLNKNIKNFEVKVTKFNKNSKPIEKLKFYTREEFTEDDIQKLVLPVIFNFGYVIQFGICCPISFVFLLILVLFSRIANSISMIYLFYVKSINICKGLTIYNQTQFILIFVGFFSNLGIIFYTKNNTENDFSLIYKLFIFIIIQNGIIVIYSVLHFDNLPFWFRYKENIKLKYLKKFGVAQSSKNDKVVEVFDKNKSIY